MNRDRQLEAPVAEKEKIVRNTEFVWISHDWVEVVPLEDTPSRRKTFGLDAVRADAECADPNCRACLIDFVYGREF